MWKDIPSQNRPNMDLRLVAEEILGQPARRSTRYVQYHAPSRRDSSPSLTVWADGYKDFGSDDSGDLFGFLATYANLTFAEALQFLEGRSSIVLSHQSRRPTASDRNTPNHPSTAWQSAVTRFLAHAQHILWHTRAGDHARAYLESQGYQPSTIENQGLGLNLGWHRLEIAGESEPIWVAPGILYPWSQADTLYGVKIRLPYQRDGQPDDLARRLKLAPGPMKYMQIKGSVLSQAWYGTITDAALPLILVEGEKDRDNLAQLVGDEFNVMTLGSATGRIPDGLWPQLKSAAWIAIVLDNDAAGQSNASRLAEHINSRLLDDPAFTVSLPTPDKDLTDCLLSGADLSVWLHTLANLGHARNISCDPDFVGAGHRTRPSAEWHRAIPYESDSDLSAPARQMETAVGGDGHSQAEMGSALYFPNGLPDALREMLLGLHQLTPQGRAYIADHSAAALVLELITDAFCHQHLSADAAEFTIQRLAEISMALGRHTSAKTIRRGLDQLVALHLVELIPFSTPYKLSSNFLLDAEKGKNDFAGTATRPNESDSDGFSPLSTQWRGVGGGDDSATENCPLISLTRGRPAQKYRPCDFRQALPKFLENLANRLRESLFAATTPDRVDPAWFEWITDDPATREQWAETVAAASADLDQAYADIQAKLEAEIDLRVYTWSLHLNWMALRGSTSTPIPADLPFASGRAYRDAYYQARVAAAGSDGRQISRAKAAAEIGVNSRTLTRVRERVGIVTEAQFKEFSLTRPDKILAQADSLAPWAANRTFGRYLKSSNGARIALHPENRYAEGWANAQIAQGHTLTLQIQIASREYLTTPDDAHEQRQRRLTHYRDCLSRRMESVACAESETAPIEAEATPARSSNFRDALRREMPYHQSPLATQWGGVGGGDDFAACQRDGLIGDDINRNFGYDPDFVGAGHRAAGWHRAIPYEGESTPPRLMERELGGEVEFSVALASGPIYTFALAYVRDQLALRLPYLHEASTADPRLHRAIRGLMGGNR